MTIKRELQYIEVFKIPKILNKYNPPFFLSQIKNPRTTEIIPNMASLTLLWKSITCSPVDPTRSTSLVLPHRTLRYQSHYLIY